MQTIAIVNQKGGVGKTTTAIALSHGLALRNRSVLLVDMDPQGNAAAALKVTPAPCLFRLLTGDAPPAHLPTEIRPGFYLLPGDPATAELAHLVQADSGLLGAALAQVATDYIVVDTGPSRSRLHQLVYAAADSLIIPTTCDFLGLLGVTQQFDSLLQLRRRGARVPEVIGILPTFWDSQTTESATNLRALVDAFGDLVTPAIPRRTKLREGPAHGLTPWETLTADQLTGYSTLIERLIGAELIAAS